MLHEFVQKLLQSLEKVAPEMKQQYKIDREMEKIHIFRSAVLDKRLCFLTKFLRFGSPWGLWKLELLRRHHLFEAMLILRVPEPRKIIFGSICFFNKTII